MASWRRSGHGTRTARMISGGNSRRSPEMRQDGRTAVTFRFSWHLAVVALLLALALPAPSRAQAAEKRGQATNLPLPRYVSLKVAEGNARRGPTLSHRIDWVFKRRDMPLQITAEHGHWRRVQDRDGAGGWMHYALLSGTRTVLVEQETLQIRSQPDESSSVVAVFEQSVIARLGECNPGWCRISSGGYRGWAPKKALWGVAPDELRD